MQYWSNIRPKWSLKGSRFDSLSTQSTLRPDVTKQSVCKFTAWHSENLALRIRAITWSEENSVGNLQYGPQTRLGRDMTDDLSSKFCHLQKSQTLSPLQHDHLPVKKSSYWGTHRSQSRSVSSRRTKTFSLKMIFITTSSDMPSNDRR